MSKIKKLKGSFTVFLITAIFITSCDLQSSSPNIAVMPTSILLANPALPATASTPLPTRTNYTPGELVDYTAQTGDTLPALAKRFNTTVEEILQANTQIPRDATTMPPGMPMKIPIYYLALWASPFQIIPDHAFVNGPTTIGFNTAAYVATQPGWLKDYRVYVSGEWRSGAEMVDYIATNYSMNPRLLLAILEYQGGALTQSDIPEKKNLLGLKRQFWDSHYLQLVLAANELSNGYYGWRAGTLLEFKDTDGFLIRPDPWQNAASVAVQYYYSEIFAGDEYAVATGPEGLFLTYKNLFDDPWSDSLILIPGSLQQPVFRLPFPDNQAWSYTGGPHTGWGTGEPLAAIDFAPPAEKSGCVAAGNENYSTAMADGLIVRSTVDGIALDLDKDGDERTGWVIFYLHLATDQRAPLGSELNAGDLIGYPSCEGGHSTGTHVHIARKYNGEWIVADSAIPFTMNGWVTHNGSRAYLGTLTKGSSIVIACDCSDADSSISSGPP
ncbi:MAG: LysM peptidoglycan-binding domain-containing protein [Chloroflexi bacterium]|nr:LysM peptidoglycan-binding domain-containing protein [Chloroflexota bacterium]